VVQCAPEDIMTANTITADAGPKLGVLAESQLGGRGARLVALLLDGIIGGVLGGLIGGLGAVGADPETGPNVTLMSIAGLLVLAYVIWQLWMLSTQGQTLGKKLMNLRVVKLETGRNGGFVTNVLLRALVGQGILGIIPLYGLVDALFIFRDDRRCIHDLVAGTAVVRANESA
jgi:uncharacterized RDD family membrane protein YckC